jgi:6-phosphogluconolactonase
MTLSRLRLPSAFAAFALLGVTGCSTGGSSGGGGVISTPVPVAAKAQLAYVGGNNGVIYGFTVSSTGMWTPTSPANVTATDNFGAMAIDPLGKFLFFAGFLAGNVTSYSITPGTGTLTVAGTAPASNSNNRPESMTIDPSGRFVYVSNTGLNTVSTFVVNRTTGALTAAADTVLPNSPGNSAGSSPIGIVTDPTGKFLYVAEYTYVVCYSIDQTSGVLTPLATPTVPGTDYFTLRLDPTGKYIYGTSGRSNSVSLYSINASTGALTFSGNTATGNGATDIGLTVDGTHAYVIDRDDQTISLFNMNETSGGLTPLAPPTVTDIGQPYIIQMDPGGQLAYVVREADGIETFRINADGTLSQYSGVGINAPVGLVLYPSHP